MDGGDGRSNSNIHMINYSHHPSLIRKWIGNKSMKWREVNLPRVKIIRSIESTSSEHFHSTVEPDIDGSAQLANDNPVGQQDLSDFILNSTHHDTSSEVLGDVSATLPYIDRATPARVTAYKGVSAILPCYVNNLGQRSVSIPYTV